MVLDWFVILIGFLVIKQSVYGLGYNLRSVEIKVWKEGEIEWVIYLRVLIFRNFKGVDL